MGSEFFVMNVGMMSGHCLMCREKSGNPVVDMGLSQLEQLLYDVPSIELKQRMNWDIHLRCKYGISCSTLRQIEQRYKMRAEQLEGKIRWVAREGTNDQFCRMLQHLRGKFPIIYREMEIERAKATQKG